MDNRWNQTKGGDGQSVKWTNTAVQRKHISFNEDVETKWRGDFYFIQGADTQYGLIDRYILKLEKPNWDKEIILTEETVRRVNLMQPKPNFFVVCGDLADAYPVETPELRKQQEFSFKTIFNKLDKDIPLVCICGNHDVGNQPTYESVQSYRSSFGDDYFSFWSGGIFFICINSQFYIDSSLVPDLIKEQDIWLDKQLEFYRSHIEKNSDSNKVGPVLFQHVPWFLNDPFDKETDPYFVVAYDLRMKMLDKLVNAGVKYVFCGHMHRNSGGHYKQLESIVTSAIGGQLPLSDDPNPAKSGMRIVKVHKDKIIHKYYNIEDLPSEIKPAEETFE